MSSLMKIPLNWELKIKKNKHGVEQVEIKDGYGVVIIVSLGEGYVYKSYGKPWWHTDTWGSARDRVKGVNIHMAMNGPLQCSFSEFDEIYDLIQVAKAYLRGERDNVDID